MRWSRKLPKPLVLKDGRTILTLSDARAVMLALPERHQQRPHWQYAAQLVLEAADGKRDLLETWAQIGRALDRDGMV